MDCVCMHVGYMVVSMCDGYLHFWHLFLILSVVKCTVNKLKQAVPNFSPIVSFPLSLGPRHEFYLLSGSLNDITVFM